MKTKMKNIAVAFVLAFAVTSLNATELNKSVPFEMNFENAMEMEAWMVNESFFDTNDSKDANSTVVEIAVANPDFSILVDAVVKANLAEALSAEGPFTVFAPTNSAFNTLFKQLDISGIEDLTAEQLVPILTYHVVSGKVMSTDLSNTKVATLNEGNHLKVDISDGVKINESSVVSADIVGKNGVIHVIDKVLIPN